MKRDRQVRTNPFLAYLGIALGVFDTLALFCFVNNLGAFILFPITFIGGIALFLWVANA